MASSSTHTRKRQYQPSNQTTLNSYFARHAGTSNCQPRSPMSPPLPEDVQSSLVNVGMRVRKAMSDAYPTHKATGLASSANPLMSSAPVRPMVRQELQPFCGLHKTGGWAVQVQPPASSAPAVVPRAEQDYEEEDDVPILSMSQNTIPSTQSSFMSAASSSNPKKRAYEDEAENEMDAFFDESDTTLDAAMEQPIVPRRMASMKATSRKTNANRLVHIVDDDGEFPEADFLMPMEME